MSRLSRKDEIQKLYAQARDIIKQLSQSDEKNFQKQYENLQKDQASLGFDIQKENTVNAFVKKNGWLPTFFVEKAHAEVKERYLYFTVCALLAMDPSDKENRAEAFLLKTNKRT